MTDILMSSITAIAQQYRTRALSPVDVTTEALKRVTALNPTLNAFITVTGERAMKQARCAEAELQAGVDRGPLHGIPVALKDLIDVTGTPTTCGSRIRAHHLPQHSAQLAVRLDTAGAVLLGKTNMLEFAYGVVHPDYGQTNNPHDPHRTAGGSSGGSAAGVAAGCCFAAVGTDTGGSIRIPAAYCGIAGLKPTYGLVNLGGVFPLSWSLDHAGPMARTCQDTALLLEALTGKPVPTPDLSRVRLGVLTAHAEGHDLHEDVAQVFSDTCAVLRRHGTILSDVTIPDLEFADDALMNVLLPEASALHAPWLQSQADDYAPFTRTQLELGFAIPAVTHVRAQQYRRLLARRFLEAFENVDALLTPTVAWEAPHEDPVIAGEEGASEARRTAPSNLTGFPALSVPAGLGAHGLPIGIQIVTPPHQDALALAIGSMIERLRRTPAPAA